MERLEKRKAYDLQSYKDTGNFDFESAVTGLASVVIEYGKKRPLYERVWPYKLVARNGGVVDLEGKDGDISLQYSFKDELDKIESEAGLKIREVILNEPVGSACVWMSPKGGPRNYQEGKVEVGVNEIIEGEKTLVSYGITVDWDPYFSLHKALVLSEFSKNTCKLLTPEDLRREVIVFNMGSAEKSWKVIRDSLPLKEVWQAIDDGRVEKLKREALTAARSATEQIKEGVLTAKTEKDFVAVGAKAESVMVALGWPVVGGLDCGELNSTLQAQNYRHVHIEFLRGKTEKRYVKKCGGIKKDGRPCGMRIEKFISQGYKCQKCGGVYKGC